MSDEAKMVQDSIEVQDLVNGSSSVPVKLHTLLVRRPGRVSAAMDFIDKALSVVGFGACGDGDEVGRDAMGEGRSVHAGNPSKEFLEARRSALRTMTAYFEGLIDDELIVHAEFKIDGKKYDARFAGKIDGATGVVRDPRYAPARIDAPPTSVAPDPRYTPARIDAPPTSVAPDPRTVPPAPAPDEQAVITLAGGARVILPPGVQPRDLRDVGVERPDPTRPKDPQVVTLFMKNGNRMTIDPRDGTIIG